MKRTLLLVMLLGWGVQSAEAIVTSDEFGSHVVTPGQPSFGVNTDGVVMIGGLQSPVVPLSNCTGCLITDRHVLSAAHCFDEDGNGEIDPLVWAFPHDAVFDLADGLVVIENDLASLQWPDSWMTSRGDLAVVTLTEDAPPGVPRYPLYGAMDEVGQPFVLVGYGQPGYGATGEEPVPPFTRDFKRAGLNRHDAIRGDYPDVDFLAYDFDSGEPENNALTLFGYESDLGFGADEVFMALGDSGSLSFIGGAVAGVTAFRARLPEADVNDDLDSSWGEAAFNTRVSGFQEFILEATDGAAVFLSEPTIPGDMDGDREINFADLSPFVWGLTDIPGYEAMYPELADSRVFRGDVNQDGFFNFGDLTPFADVLTAPASGSAAIPEPTTWTLGIVFAAQLLLLRFRIATCW